MGVFSVRVRLLPNARGRVPRELEMVVDTGASYTVIPRSIAEELGIRPVRRTVARLANGTRATMEMGQAELEVGGLRTVTWIVFGDAEDVALLGAVTLQELGLEVDPTTETLRPTDAYLLAAEAA